MRELEAARIEEELVPVLGRPRSLLLALVRELEVVLLEVELVPVLGRPRGVGLVLVRELDVPHLAQLLALRLVGLLLLVPRQLDIVEEREGRGAGVVP